MRTQHNEIKCVFRCNEGEKLRCFATSKQRERKKKIAAVTKTENTLDNFSTRSLFDFAALNREKKRQVNDARGSWAWC